MPASVEQAVQERSAQAATAPKATAVPHAANSNTLTANDNGAPGLDAMDFVRANRIHVEHGSLFVDPYLVIHPRELDPANELALRKKLQLTYSINNPSFYEAPERMSIALGLGQLVPVSLGASRSKLMDAVGKFNAQVDSGVDTQLQQQADDKRNPFTAVVRDVTENPGSDPVGVEVLKNGLAIYMLIREKLTQNHYLDKLTDYVNRSNTPDQILHDLSDNLGVSPQQVREAALKGGLDGVGQLLGLDPKYVTDVKKLADKASTQDFGYNMVEHWHLGRQLLGLDAPMEQKIAAGMQARIDHKIAEYRGRVGHYYDVPDPVKREEARIAHEDMSVLEPIQKKLMFALGYELCHTDETTADSIAFHKGIYGLHRKAANDLSDIEATYKIYYAGHGSRKGSVGTLAHEVAHNFWPNYFDKPTTARIDQLVNNDAARFTALQKLMDTDFDAFEKLHEAYKAGDAQEKAAVIASANERFAPLGLSVDGLFPTLRDAKSFRLLVWDAGDVLAIEGARYNRSGYDTPQERFREVISRYAEMRQVSHRDEFDVLKYVAPGLTEVWDKHYIPHLEKVYQDVLAFKEKGYNVNTGAAIGTNIGTIRRPANNNDELPKVDEKPAVAEGGTPVTMTPTTDEPAPPPQPASMAPNADRMESSTPDMPSRIVNSVQLDPQRVAATSALHSMGIN